MKTEILPFSPPSFTEEEQKAVLECIKSSWVGTGPKTIEFENLFANYKQSAFAGALSSCTSALFLSLKTLGIGKGDEVITTAMTFCSTVNVILHCGAKPVLCDIEESSKNINTDNLERLINSKTKAIIPVHYAGFPCDMDKIIELANKYELSVIEDCAHAIESKFNNKHCGTFGDIGCFSFYATKNMAIGEGGMAISDHENLISKIKMLGLHGLSRDAWKRFESSNRRTYDVKEIGFKMNLTDIQSAIGIVQLERIEEMRKRRREIWNFYNQNLLDLPIELPSMPKKKGSIHAMHLYACGLPKNIDRDDFVWKAAHEHGVTFGVHYKSINTFSIYKSILPEYEPVKALPVSFDWGNRTISLSCSAGTSHSHCERVVDTLRKLLK